MASSLLTGDRRWAPTRKSGMTVLGKVPKPINLPSQRLENHGLDPNVEIVPKGTLTWGSRQSLAAPNAWGSSTLSSPNTDGSAGSPSHVSGRPSSGGSGTRPSTAGSDRSHELASNVWGPNSRPSTASGILASNQISQAATRPRSAETRPGSSQLSRFAENTVDSPVAWGTTGTVERLGALSSKTNFTLSSGDFPTLGSEKSSESQIQQGHSSQGRPASASGTASALKEALDPQLAVPGNWNLDHSVHGNVKTWRADNYPSVGRGAPPNMENWQKNPQQAQSYPSGDVAPHQFDSWHNPPVHPSDGVWYRGGSAGGPYRPPGPPCNYPVVPYYPHVPARPLHNAQAFPRPEAGPGGYHPKNGDSYRPHMPPEPYMVPNHSAIPVRPGVYPGLVPYDGYYGPPRGSFSSSSNQEVLLMGIAARPGVYNQYPTQNANINPEKFHARPGGYSPVLTKEQMKSDQAHEPQGRYKVLLKQHDGWEDHDARDKREQSVIVGSPHLERGNQPRVSMRDGDWRTNSRKHEPASSQPASDRDGHSLDTVVRNLFEDSSKVADGSLMRKSETTIIQVHDLQQYPVTKKNATLMEKVEGLNSKARTTDGLSVVGVVSSEGKTKSFKNVSTNADHFTKVVYDDAASTEDVPTSSMAKPVPGELNAVTKDKNQESSVDQKVSSGSQVYVVGKSKTVDAGESTHFQDQRRIHDIKGVDHRAKLRSIRHDNDEWMKKSTGSGSSVNTIVANGENRPGVCAPEYHGSQEAPEKQELHHAANACGGSYTASSLDSVDEKAQRAKIKERVIQRSKQRQEEEEEERTREQKAKALAKNRRKLAESSNLKSSHASPPSNRVLNKPDSEAGAAPTADAIFIEAPSGTLPCDSEAVKQTNDDDIKIVGESTNLSSDAAAQASDSAAQASVVPQDQFMSLGQETKTTETTQQTTTDIHDNIVSKQKQMGYRRKQSILQEKSLGEKQTTYESTGSAKYDGKVVLNAPNSDTLPNNEDPSVQHRKKNNRGTRNRNKLDECLSSFTSPSSAQNEGNSEKCGTESGKTKPSASLAEAVSVPAESLKETVGIHGSMDVAVISSNEGLSESTEETHGRVSNHWKPHPHRKSIRNQHAHKPVAKYHGTEAVIWAPVKPPNKNEPSEEVNQNSTTEATNPSSGKNGHDVQNGTKAKRAEMERYIPKPVAKELSQQGNTQQTSPPLSQSASGDMSGKPEPGLPSVGTGRVDEPTVAKASFASDTKNGETGKHNKHGITHASWRQCGSAESPSHSQNSLDGSLSSDANKSVQKCSDQLQPSKVDSLPKEQSIYTDDDWNGNNDVVPPSESDTTTAAKNYGASRQRCQPAKAHRVTGSNYAPTDNKDLQREMADKSGTQPPSSGLRTENQNASGEHMKSRWQPKSQAYSTCGRQANRGGGGQRFASQSDQSDKEYPPQGTENNPMQNVDNNAPSQRTVGAEARDAGHQEAKRERNAIANPLKGQTPSLKQDSPTTVELAPANVDVKLEQSVSTVVHRRGQYNGPFQRGQDMTYNRGRDSGQDAGRQNLHINEDKQKNNMHLEYQHYPGSRYRERGRHHPRGGGGHFYGRSSGAVARVGDSYNSGE